MSNKIILTTGIYDAIKDHLRRKKVSHNEEVRLTSELRNALQVRRRALPEDVVTLNRKVTIKDHSQNNELLNLLDSDSNLKYYLCKNNYRNE